MQSEILRLMLTHILLLHYEIERSHTASRLPCLIQHVKVVDLFQR
ncbi:hypothetical protein EDE11_10873 [Methylomonas methanica]|uniref:Uncharacterized protein n=1 Tax=Methylomonas methanica TaxID=421 RepID=A0ABY2CM61_METMH|nr:hypothetical protein EDE11_10873 [Methylomonas methanica]